MLKEFDIIENSDEAKIYPNSRKRTYLMCRKIKHLPQVDSLISLIAQRKNEFSCFLELMEHLEISSQLQHEIFFS